MRSSTDKHVFPSLPMGTSFQVRRSAILTASILTSFLQQYEILSVPDKSSAQFKWAVSLIDRLGDISMETFDPSILYICEERGAKELLESVPALFVVVITQRQQIPNWIAKNKNRTVLLLSNGDADFIASEICNFFAEMLLWEDELDGIVARKEKVSSLLTEASRMLGSFICLTDAGYNLMGASTEVEPPHAVFRNLLENECYGADRIKRIETTLAEPKDRRGMILETHSQLFDGITVINYPVFSDGVYFGLLTVATKAEIDVEALKDMFLIVARRTTRLMEAFWEEKLKVNSPWFQVFTKIIRGERMTQEFVDVQLSQTEVPKAKLFKLVCLDMGIDTKQSIRQKVTATAHNLNDGQNYVFAFNDSLLVLYYLTSGNNVPFSSRNVERDISEDIFKPFGIRAGVSRIFDNIFDLAPAYKQTRLALNFSAVTDAEQSFAGITPSKACYFFDYTLPYYLVADSCANNALSSFSLSRNVVQSIVHDDQQNNSNIAQVLWMYLCNNHSATAIAKQMHVHRNTILYHIDKIEKTYDFQIDNLLDRSKLITDFRLYFLTDGFQSEIDYSKLLTIANVDSELYS